MTKIEIQSQQNFTSIGSAGVLMFLGGPLLSAFGYHSVVQAALLEFPGDTSGYWILVWLGAIAFQVGCVFMLVGRTYDHQVVVRSEQATAKKDELEWA
ncbi:hypothetical protein [Mesorhizobium sp. ORS 3428]|uniref:hypothetical protein n=1 Tax=Mesorhizobium sp. ORS 3428 TaxID=540997 RepID=UPI001041D2CD|nr:hypothetical protein [Mesorhizobium sp. ORS 3428]